MAETPMQPITISKNLLSMIEIIQNSSPSKSLMSKLTTNLYSTPLKKIFQVLNVNYYKYFNLSDIFSKSFKTSLSVASSSENAEALPLESAKRNAFS